MMMVMEGCIVEILSLIHISHTINAFNEMADVVRLYSKKPKTAEQRLANLLSEVLYEDSESVDVYKRQVLERILNVFCRLDIVLFKELMNNVSFSFCHLYAMYKMCIRDSHCHYPELRSVLPSHIPPPETAPVQANRPQKR